MRMSRYIKFDPETEMKIYNLHCGEEQLSQSTLGKRFGVRSDRIKMIVNRVRRKLGVGKERCGKGYCNGKRGRVQTG